MRRRIGSNRDAKSRQKKFFFFFCSNLKWNQFSVLFCFSVSSLCTYPAVPECCRPTSPRRAVENVKFFQRRRPSSITPSIDSPTQICRNRLRPLCILYIHIPKLIPYIFPSPVIAKLYLFWLLVFFETHKKEKEKKRILPPFSIFPFHLNRWKNVLSFASFHRLSTSHAT